MTCNKTWLQITQRNAYDMHVLTYILHIRVMLGQINTRLLYVHGAAQITKQSENTDTGQ